jgi:methylmalonyl-CoA/ethylmalonyl-CoA epimerase
MEGQPMPQVKQVNHVAVVVDNMEKALTFWRDALGMELHELRDVPAEKSQVAFLPLPGSEVELVQPTTEDSGIAKYLAKRGPGMHHLCLEVDDIEGMLAQLKSKNVRLINEEPRLAADGKKYAFIHPESTGGVLLELYQI